MIKQPSIDVTQDPGLHRNPIVQQIVKPIVPFSIPKYHWVADTPDPRDLIYQVSTSIATPPATVDLRSHCSPIDDQGQLGSCTGNAIAGAIDYLDYKSGKPDRVSRLFIYYYERLIENTVNYDSGAQIRDGIKATYTYGVPQESLWPYNINQFKTKPSTAAIADAARRKVTQYQRALDFNAVKNALQNGYPVTIGFTV